MDITKELDRSVLSELKQARNNEIDDKTGSLVGLGYTWATKQFSLSQNAQINIIGLDNVRTELTYPIIYNTINDSDVHSISDATEIHNMYLTALATKKARLDSGTSLKTQIRNATTIEEVDAVVDLR